ncbi:MAG: hypothetical protein RLZZ623_1970 [Actinomycetota bacterium]|jgi:hypothetical protein
MSRTTPVLEDRLARYRPTLDEAIAERTALASADQLRTGNDLVELDWQPVEPGRSSNRSRVLVGASAVVIIGGLAAIVATRDTPPVTPANSVKPVDTEPSNESTAPSGVVIDTTPATTIAGSGLTPACPPGTDTIGTGTLYLGGPASDQNLAAPGFIFSQPSGRTAVDVAIGAIALPVIGQECSIDATPAKGIGHVIVTVNPPAVPTSLRLDVNVSERDGIIGVTGIKGITRFETNRVGDGATLTLIDGVPASATRIQVRFKKGDDVWELTADTTTGTAINLAVPNGETDRFLDQNIDWVLFTAIDANEHVVDAGGGII